MGDRRKWSAARVEASYSVRPVDRDTASILYVWTSNRTRYACLAIIYYVPSVVYSHRLIHTYDLTYLFFTLFGSIGLFFIG